MIYTSIAARDLARHSTTVFEALSRGNLADARVRVAAIVGRDTARLDEPEIVRAAVESVAESTVDGVTAPAFLRDRGRPTRRNRVSRNQHARFDVRTSRPSGIGNLVGPLHGSMIWPITCLHGLRRRWFAWPRCSLDNGLRARCESLHAMGRNHDSPNSGLTEAAMAGALGVQLGGTNHYDGQPLEKPTLGDPITTLAARHIPAANTLMLATAGLLLAVLLPLRFGAICLWQYWRAVS